MPVLARLRSTRGAVDLVTVMVGVIVVGVIATGVFAAVFGVIPWTQDHAAAQNLNAVTTAQAVARAKSADAGSGEYLDTAGLVSEQLLPAKTAASVTVATGADGNCWAAVAKSATGSTVWSEDTDPKPRPYRPGDSTVCTGVDLAALANAGDQLSWAKTTSLGPKTAASAAVSPDGKTLLVASSTGLWYSTDKGASWQSGNVDWLTQPVTSLRFSPDGKSVAAVAGDTLELSVDGGRSFTAIPTPGAVGYSIAAVSGNTVAALTQGVMWLTKNAGQSWTRVSSPAPGGTAVAGVTSADASRIVLVGNDGNAYVSSDSGVHWTTRPTGSKSGGRVAGSQDARTIVFTDGTSGGMFISRDGGNSWSPTTLTLAVTAVSVSYDGQHIAVGGAGSAPYTSTDGGMTWHRQTGGPGNITNPITISGDGSTVFYQSGLNVYVGTFQ